MYCCTERYCRVQKKTKPLHEQKSFAISDSRPIYRQTALALCAKMNTKIPEVPVYSLIRPFLLV